MPPSRIALRDDYDAVALRRLVKGSRDSRQARRLLSLAAVYDGMSRAAAAALGGMDRQTLRDWVHFLHQRPTAASAPGPARTRSIQKGFPRTLAAQIGHLAKDKPIEIWFQDGEPDRGRRLRRLANRLGQKYGRTRIWAKTGTRPRLPADQRYEDAYLFGAICPRQAKGAALMLPRANAGAMQIDLDEIS